MIARLPSWLWMLLCIVSFTAALGSWNAQRLERARSESEQQPAAGAPEFASIPASASTPAAAELAPELKRNPAVQPPPATPASIETPRLMPVESGSGTRVLRCSARGRITYIDPSSACPDGSVGKLTTLPR